jgi:transmembrane sensor
MTGSQAIDVKEDLVDQACYWVIQFDAGGVSPEDRSRYTQWLHESPEHRKAVEEVRSTWRRFDTVQRLRSENAASDKVEKWLGSRSRRRRLAPLATAATVAAIAVGLWLMQSPTVHEIEYSTAIGEQRATVLPDESLMTLNTNSRVEVHYSRDERTVELQQGEVHFEVAPAADRPFLVVADAGTVRAVGTAFAVYLKGTAVEVTVVEGTVEVLPRVESAKDLPLAATPDEDNTLAQIVTERHKLRYENGVVEAPAAVTAEEIERRLAWRRGMLDFVNAPLADVIAEAGRYTQDELIIVDPALETHEFTGYFCAGDVTLLMNLLESNGFIEARRVDRSTVHIALTGTLPH